MPQKTVVIKKKIKQLGKKNVESTTALLRDRRNWFEFLLRGIGYQFPGMFMSVITIGIITAGLVYIHKSLEISLKVPPTFHTVLGLVVGLLLVFRTNTAYERWWEGRKQLGSLNNICRSMALKINAYFPNGEDKQKAVTLVWLFAHTLKEHLRQANYQSIEPELPAEMQSGFRESGHKPLFLLNELNLILFRLYQTKNLTGSQLIVLEGLINELTNIVGACERIHNTPMPVGYALHLKRILLIYLVTLPTGFISDLEWWAVPVVMLIFYTMVGIELIGEEIEDPFGTDTNDLPFDNIADRIKAVVCEITDSAK